MKLEDDTLDMQINWKDKSFISPLEKQDKLEVWYLREGFQRHLV
jgi:hypothetical protein